MSLPPSDTICAIATPFGEGAIGLLRLTGPRAIQIAERIFQGSGRIKLSAVRSHTIQHGYISNPKTGEVIDEVLVTVMRAPRSYTGEETVEISGHGGPIVLNRILETLLAQDARLALPGEFTQRAFLNGRMDLSQAEAVMDLIQAKTTAAQRAALQQLQGALGREVHSLRAQVITTLATIEALIDFSEEDLGPDYRPDCIKQVCQCRDRIQALLDTAEEGRIIRDGLSAVIVGRPNVGKSSLLNMLVKFDRAIVSPIAGTTRDTLEEHLNVDGLYLRIIDTAGLQPSLDPIERDGIRRTEEAIDRGDLILMVVNAEEGFLVEEEEFLTKRLKGKQVILIINKMDVASQSGTAIYKGMKDCMKTVCLSATLGQGHDALKTAIRTIGPAQSRTEKGGLFVARVRHITALRTAKEDLNRALSAMEQGESEEIIAIDLRASLDSLGEIVGATTNEDILGRIFETFCIGK